MKNIEFNVITGEEIITETSDVPVVEVVIPEQLPTTEEVLTDLIQLLVDKGVIY